MSGEMDTLDVLVERARTNGRALLILLGLVLAGAAILVAGEHNSDAHQPIWRAVLLSVGGLLVASATLAFVWELVGKRRFAQEVLAAAGVAADVRLAGLRAISDDYVGVVDWPEHFRQSMEIDLLVSWGATWRKRYERQWVEWVEQKNVRLRVMLPNADNSALVEHLAKRFMKDPGYVQDHIEESRDFYLGLTRSAGPGATVDVRYLDRAPVWGYYRLGATVVATLFPASTKSTPGVPAMVFETRGQVGQFFQDQFDKCWSEGAS